MSDAPPKGDEECGKLQPVSPPVQMNAKVNQNSLNILKCNNYEESQRSILKQSACFNYKFASRVMQIFILSFTQINQKFLKI